MKRVSSLFLSAGIVLATVCAGCSSTDDGDADGDGASGAVPEVATVGMRAPDFTLTDVAGKTHRLADYTRDGKIVVIEWFNPDCPYTKAYHTPERRMAGYLERVADDGVVWLAINSNAPGTQGSGLERNRRAAQEYKIPYPILLDENGAVGRRYAARSTPHMFVVSADGVLLYDGAIDDDASPREGQVNYVLAAIEQHRAGQPVAQSKTEPYGCSVKYAN